MLHGQCWVIISRKIIKYKILDCQVVHTTYDKHGIIGSEVKLPARVPVPTEWLNYYFPFKINGLALDKDALSVADPNLNPSTGQVWAAVTLMDLLHQLLHPEHSTQQRLRQDRDKHQEHFEYP